MLVGRVLSSLAASLAVGGCAVVVVGMSHAVSAPVAAKSSSPPTGATGTTATYLPPVPGTLEADPGAITGPSRSARRTAVTQTPSRASGAAAHPISTPAPARTSAPVHRATRATTHAAPATTTHHAAPAPMPKHTSAAPHGQSLPLGYTTGTATRVITVVAHSYASTTATLQPWTKASGGGWYRYGSPVTAHVGADGLSTQASEYRSATPIGSFTLTQAFGYYSDPGTPLPYIHTTPSDWWISQPGSLYNTHQHCASGCSFTRGDPNEHLYYETPYYNYAVVIDYNTRNAPGGVTQGKGSAFFLHVTDGASTAGCVAIPQANLVSIMRWLTPSAHPRILIGVT